MTNFSTREWETVERKYRDICAPYLDELPVRVGRLAGDLGLSVSAATLRTGVSGEIRPDQNSPSGFTIRVNRHENKYRQRFTVAHEISHFLLHRNLIQNGITDNVLYRSTLSSEVEAQANRLAADILMPRDSLNEWIKNNIGRAVSEEDLPEISEATFVSKVALKIRLNL